MPEALIREARLRPEHAGSYPTSSRGCGRRRPDWLAWCWSGICTVRSKVRRRTVRCRKSHFEFRGPSLPPEARPGGRSRQTDVSVAEAERDLEHEPGTAGGELDAAEAGLADARELDQRFEDLERRDEELRRMSRERPDPQRPPEEKAETGVSESAGSPPGSEDPPVESGSAGAELPLPPPPGCHGASWSRRTPHAASDSSWTAVRA